MTLPAATPWLSDSATQTLCKALEAEGAAVYFVGGCVRDALLGIRGADVDLATPLRPEDVMRLAEVAGLRVVPTGIDHGTVMVISKGRGFEVTTFRRDVETDGRRAVVAFSTDIAEDARRRDFTLNALYATSEGAVIDPLGTGLADCVGRRIRFIEDATTRIREDYLRILRYFRFHAWYARAGDGFDRQALDAIAQNSAGLETLSAERIGHEMIRLLDAPDPSPAVACMRQTGCLSRLLPGSDDRFLGPVVHLEASLSLPPDPILRLAAIGGVDVADRLRLSRDQGRRLAALRDGASSSMPNAEIAYRQGTSIARAVLILRSAVANAEVATKALKDIESGAAARFPVTAADLMPAFEGKALGAKLADLERAWIASGFALSREDLMKSAS